MAEGIAEGYLSECESENRQLRADLEAARAEINFYRGQNGQLHQQLDRIRAKVHDHSLLANQIVGALRMWLDNPKFTEATPRQEGDEDAGAS